jgi:hypothetical protein
MTRGAAWAGTHSHMEAFPCCTIERCSTTAMCARKDSSVRAWVSAWGRRRARGGRSGSRRGPARSSREEALRARAEGARGLDAERDDPGVGDLVRGLLRHRHPSPSRPSSPPRPGLDWVSLGETIVTSMRAPGRWGGPRASTSTDVMAKSGTRRSFPAPAKSAEEVTPLRSRRVALGAAARRLSRRRGGGSPLPRLDGRLATADCRLDPSRQRRRLCSAFPVQNGRTKLAR